MTPVDPGPEGQSVKGPRGCSPGSRSAWVQLGAQSGFLVSNLVSGHPAPLVPCIPWSSMDEHRSLDSRVTLSLWEHSHGWVTRPRAPGSSLVTLPHVRGSTPLTLAPSHHNETPLFVLPGSPLRYILIKQDVNQRY